MADALRCLRVLYASCIASFVLLASVPFVGCGGDDAVHGIDLGGDLSSADGPKTRDMGAKYGCAGYATCMTDCLSGTTPTLQGCVTTCNKNAKSSTVSSTWLDMLDCGRSYCLGNADAGGFKCTLDAPGSMLTDRAGDPMGTCGNCLNDAFARAFGGTCANMSSPDCNPATCKPVNDTCLNDTP